jgi:N-acetyl-anhydromuramyl-L-alanine amidase AmpD
MRMHQLITHGEEGNKPKLIIIHAIAERVVVPNKGVYDAPDFMAKSKELIGSRVSAHSIIMPSGLNVRMRHDSQTAWHAKSYNEDSLGIEFTVPGEHDYESFLEAMKTPYLTEDEYQAGLYQVMEWLRLHDIQEIARHCDKDQYMKSDPGAGFPWEDFLHDLGE